jgi:tRNA G26 N,N-dimethylase Trm1
MSVFIQPEVAAAILDVIDELSSEIDLYYEDDNLAAATPAFTKMEKLVKMLESAGYTAPDSYHHIIGRYRKFVN